MQEKVERLPSKSATMEVRCTRTRLGGVDRHTLVGEESLEDVDSFTYLVGVIDKKTEAWTVTLSCLGRRQRDSRYLRTFGSPPNEGLQQGCEFFHLFKKAKDFQAIINNCLR